MDNESCRGASKRRWVRIERRAHCIEGSEVNEDTLFGVRRVLKQEQLRLPEDVENRLYGDGCRLSPAWRNKVTLCLASGVLPKGMTEEDIISNVRRFYPLE